MNKLTGANKYKLEAEGLDNGAFGYVYKAIDLTNQRKVAVKKIRLNDCFRPNLTTSHEDAVRTEVSMMRRVKHINIIPLIDCYDERSKEGQLLQICLVMPLCLGNVREMFEKNPKEPMEESAIKVIMKSLLSALAYMHSCNVVHGDVKTSNLLVNSIGRVKLADFGAATDEIMVRRALYGCTTMYLPPELLAGFFKKMGGSFTPKMDSWAAGMLLYELLTKKYMFNKRFLHGEDYNVPADPNGRATKAQIRTQNRHNKKINEITEAEPLKLLSDLAAFDFRKRITVQMSLKYAYVQTERKLLARDIVKKYFKSDS